MSARVTAPEGGAVKRACVDFQEAIDDFEAVQGRLRRGDPKEIALSPLTGTDYRKFRSSQIGEKS